MQEVVKTYLRYAYYTTRDTQAEADRRRGEENGVFWEARVTIYPFFDTYFQLDKAAGIDNKAKIWGI